MTGSGEQQPGDGETTPQRPSWQFSGRRGTPVDLASQQPDSLPPDVRGVLQKIARERQSGKFLATKPAAEVPLPDASTPPVAGAPVPVERRAPRTPEGDVRMTQPEMVPAPSIELVPQVPPPPATPATTPVPAAAAPAEEFGSDWLLVDAPAAAPAPVPTPAGFTDEAPAPPPAIAPEITDSPTNTGEHAMQHDADPTTDGTGEDAPRSSKPKRPMTPAEKKARQKARAKKMKEMQKAKARAAKAASKGKPAPDAPARRGRGSTPGRTQPGEADATILAPLEAADPFAAMGAPDADPGDLLPLDAPAGTPGATTPTTGGKSKASKQRGSKPMTREQKARAKAKAKARAKRGGSASRPSTTRKQQEAPTATQGGSFLSRLFGRGSTPTPAESVDANLEDATLEPLEPTLAPTGSDAGLSFPDAPAPAWTAEDQPELAEPVAPAAPQPTWTQPVQDVTPAVAAEVPDVPALPLPPAADLAAMPAPVDPAAIGAPATIAQEPEVEPEPMPEPVVSEPLTEPGVDLPLAVAVAPEPTAPAVVGVTLDEPVLPGESQAVPVASAADAVQLIGAPVTMSVAVEVETGPEPADLDEAGVWGPTPTLVETSEPSTEPPLAPAAPVEQAEPSPVRARETSSVEPVAQPSPPEPARPPRRRDPVTAESERWAPRPPRTQRPDAGEQRAMRRTYAPADSRTQEAEIRDRIEAKRRQLDDVFASLGRSNPGGRS